MKNTKESIYNFINSEEYKPMNIRDLAKVLEINNHDIIILEEVLSLLEKEGKIVRAHNGKYMTIACAGLVLGKFQGHEKGFGFVLREEADVFISAKCTNGALNKDLVLCQVTRERSDSKSSEGEIVRIIERGKEKIVGTYFQNQNFGFVVPDDKKMGTDIYIARSKTNGAVSGHKVVVKITEWLDGRKSPDGEILEIIGHKDDPGVDIMSIIKDYDVSVEFPESVYKQIENIQAEVTQEEIKGRIDLRDVKMVTIDGEDAKDLDDAVSIEKLANGHYQLGVHIADVTNYVKEGTPLDKEALKRATSIYLVDRVIPMLPHKLSNGICSLNAGVDRLALSCIMEIDNLGKVVKHETAETVIKVDRRMTYTNVYKILDLQEEVMKEYADFVDMFKMMRELAGILTEKRHTRGALDFDTEEAKIKLDENGKVTEIVKYERNIATKIIEECMLVCNETIAEDAFWQEMPFVYRSHQEPDEERINTFLEFIIGLGYIVKSKQNIYSKELQKIQEEIKGKPEEKVISRLLLRSMKQARYTATNDGHFGLAAKYYCHFTSPIRRYPDLQIHRIIKENLNKGLSEKRLENLRGRTSEVSEISSIQERVSEQMERETEDLKKCEYMKDKVGEVFTGNISGLTKWGIYVELPNTVEGLIRLADLTDDYYIFDEKKYLIIGERTKKIFRLSDELNVLVARVSVEDREIDFTLSDGE
ncbi:MAG TPA: ribonuclease R [Clostridiales bacterium]|nr:MAG: ribonuclease R [Clostridiales bacterium GWD2_32_19]HCC07733.1 ribonuclease R [Clostridiales bacterium]